MRAPIPAKERMKSTIICFLREKLVSAMYKPTLMRTAATSEIMWAGVNVPQIIFYLQMDIDKLHNISIVIILT